MPLSLKRQTLTPVLWSLLIATSCSEPTNSGPGLEAAKAGTAAAGDPTVDAVDPPAATQDTTLDVRVLGTNYDRGTTAQFLLDGASTPKIVTNSTRYRNQGEVIANITIAADALLAAYDVLITTSRGKKGIGIEKFTVNPTGKPPSCPDRVDVTISSLGGSLGSDGGSYAANLSAATGNLYFDLRGVTPPRAMRVTTSLGAALWVTRSYTNSHELVCGLTAMNPAGATGTAVMEIEWSDPSYRYTLRYGKNCVGDFGTSVPANRIDTQRSGDTWTLSGDDGEGILCRGRLNGKPNWTPVGTADGFTMQLQRSP